MFDLGNSVALMQILSFAVNIIFAVSRFLSRKFNHKKGFFQN